MMTEEEEEAETGRAVELELDEADKAERSGELEVEEVEVDWLELSVEGAKDYAEVMMDS
jgi:hypothetical protein